MKSIKLFLCALLLAGAATSATAADVGVSIGVGDPNFYGQIVIGNYPRPQVIYQQPIVVHQAATWYEPIYVRVPPGHAKNWNRYCASYGYCGRPVYFVQDTWYRDVYAPRYRSYRGDRYDKHDRHDDWDDHRGHGNKHGNKHGRDD
jgi:hypothetical protein